MGRKPNQGYAITDEIRVGGKVFVIGENEAAPNKFVTWQGYAGNADSYDWGHYKNSRLDALEDLCKRALTEIKKEKAYGKPPGKKRRKPER